MTRLLHLGRSRPSTGPGEGTSGEREGDGVGPGPGADSGTGTGTGGTGTDSGTDAGTEPGADERSGTDADAHPGTDERPGAEADAEPGRSAPPKAPPRACGDGRCPRVPARRLVTALGATLLVLAGCGFFYGAHQLRSAPSAENRALTDAEATTRVAGDVGNGLARVFSYTPDGLEATERAARSVLEGRAERQYTELMGRIRADLAEQRVTLSTQAVRTAVIELDGDSARLLVFLDQISSRGKAGTTSAAAQLTVTAHWQEDQWRIVDIRSR
ncbi:hypothetical protein ACIHJG_36920 [Streptomyces sp. NPDC052415]|uniref:hypothetical protein n=1 Tax=Streptomyces sp. NPDC052415 TaxID=3365690 RepID=UPI0037D3E8C3